MFKKDSQHTAKTTSTYPILGLAIALLLVSNASKAADDCSMPSDDVEIIEHATPDLPEISVETDEQKALKSNTDFFSWLTKTHTMPNLHFIEFIELFDDK